MPIHDVLCRECGHQVDDVLHSIDEEVKCEKCGKIMELLPAAFSFSVTPGSISKWKKRYGNTLPPEYKTSGGANIYGIPKKS